jgi:hypothetical protein
LIGLTVSCEQCGANKGEGNRWLELRHTAQKAPYFLAWSRSAEKPGSKHICSENCAHLVLNAHLAALREQAKKPSE